MKFKFLTAGLAAAVLFLSGTAQAALVTLTFSGGSSTADVVFTIDSVAMLEAQNSDGGLFFTQNNRISLLSAHYGSTSFDTTNAYYGNDINGETIEFRAGDSNSVLQLGSISGGTAEFKFDALTNTVSYSGQYNDPVNSWTDFLFQGSDFTVDLNILQAGGFGGFVNPSLDPYYSVDTLHISVSNVSAVPLPAAAWLFASGLIGLIGISRRRFK